MTLFARTPQPGGRSNRSFAQLTGVQLGQQYLDFVIPNLERDQNGGMYLTSALASRHRNPTVRAMYAANTDFFHRLNQFLVRARGGDEVALRAARRMATNFPEADELGLGYSVRGWAGSGVGAGELNDLVFNALLRFAELSQTCVLEPDALAFIPLVDIDRVSDVFATVAKRPIIQYTVEQAAKWHFDPACMHQVTVPNVWDAASSSLIGVTERLPVTDDGRVILLVDKRIVRSAPPVRAHQYTRLHFGGAARALSKAEVLLDAERNPGRLLEAIESILADDWRFRPRRDFRDRG